MLIKKITLFLIVIVSLFIFVGCGNDTEEDSLDKTKTQVEEKLKELANKDGYQITYRYTSSENGTSTSTIGANKGYSWYYEGDKVTGIAYEKSDGLTLYYLLRNGEWEYQYAFTYDKSDPRYSKDLTSEFSMFLQAYELDNSLKKGGVATIAGRKCDVYTASVNAKGQVIAGMVGVDAKWSFYIDQSTGICLKFEVEGNDGNKKTSSTFEVIEFSENALISGLKRPSDVYPINGEDPNVTGNWNLLKYVGLNSILPDKELLVSTNNYHSYEELAVGSSRYFFKVNDIFSLEDAQEYMADYYAVVVNAIKEIADDRKCYTLNEASSELDEAPAAMEEESTTFELSFIYHEQTYSIYFFIDEAVADDIDSFLIEINTSKLIEEAR